jgi:hypothetical protein
MNAFIKADEHSRRDFALGIAKSCLGVSVLPMLGGRLSAAPFEGSSKAKQVPTARNVIYSEMVCPPWPNTCIMVPSSTA